MIDKIKNWAYSKNVGFWARIYITGNLIGWVILLAVLVFAF